MPQSVDPFGDAPHPPPHFELGSIPDYLLPSVLQLYRQGSSDQSAVPPCHCTLELSIPLVEEDDPTITLEARWFVDYTPNTRLAGVVATEFLQPKDFNSTDTVRTLKSYFLDADTLGIVTGIHRVDVVLAESGAFDPNSTTQPNKAVKPGYTAAEHTFVVNVKVEADAARPACPGVPPSVRVCQ